MVGMTLEEATRKLMQNIADNQLAVAPAVQENTSAYWLKRGQWEGLEMAYCIVHEWINDNADLLKELEAKQYNNHEVACIITDLFGDPCACNFNNIDEWLPYKCDFRETCCPNPVGVACWEQYLKHKEGR